MRTLSWLLPCVLIGCASDAQHGGVDLQMNDLSVIMPLPHSQAELASAMLSASAPARGGVLLPSAVYAHDSIDLDYTTLRVAAFRLDPCFGPTDPNADPSKCQNQLRVVFQPFTWDPTLNAINTSDAAVHVFYTLTREELVAAVHDMIDARLADTGVGDLGPLAPHPVIASEGLNGAMAKSLSAIVTKYAGEANLVRFTSFAFEMVNAGDIAGVADQFWVMHGYDIANAQATPMIVPTLPNNATDASLQVTAQPLFTDFGPATTSPDSLVVLANFAQAMGATASARQSAFDSALRIENPHFHNPNTIDCASCHMAQPSRQLVGDALGLSEVGDPNAFAADTAIPQADLAHTTQLIGNDGGLNIHAFSYRFGAPMINQRVINETAANVAYLRPLL
jgi:hypothetical protein